MDVEFRCCILSYLRELSKVEQRIYLVFAFLVVPSTISSYLFIKRERELIGTFEKRKLNECSLKEYFVFVKLVA